MNVFIISEKDYWCLCFQVGEEESSSDSKLYADLRKDVEKIAVKKGVSVD